MRRMVFVGVVAAALAVLTPAAFAQTPYGGNTAQNGGTHNLGDTFVVAFCGYAPGSTINLVHDGVAAGHKVAGSNGCASISITIGTQNPPQINVDDVVTGRCGGNALQGFGTAPNGQPNVDTLTYNINCAGLVSAPSGASGAGGTASPATPVPSSQLSFTGANVLRMTVIGVTLITIGTLFVMAVRRRRAARGGAAA